MWVDTIKVRLTLRRGFLVRSCIPDEQAACRGLAIVECNLVLPRVLKKWSEILECSNAQFNSRASLCKILISSFAHKMDFAHNFSVDFF